MRKIYLLLLTACTLSITSKGQTALLDTGPAPGVNYATGPIYMSSTLFYTQSRSAYLYTQAELAAAGLLTGSVVTELGWMKNNATSSNAGGKFRIFMKNSAAASYSLASETWVNLVAATVMHYENLSQVVPATANPGYINFSLNTPFTYTGGSIEIMTEWDVSAGTSPYATGAFDWMCSTVADRIYAAANTTMPASLSSTSNNISMDDKRPFLQITYIPPFPCTSPPVAGSAAASTLTPCAGTNVLLSLSGNTSGTGQSHQWESAPSATGPWTALGSSSLSAFYTVSPPAGVTYYRAQVTCGTTVASQEVALTVPTALSGNYTINAALAASATNFTSFASAMSTLKCNGVSGPVMFDVGQGSGPYNEQLIIDSIPGASPVNTITINGNGETISFTAAVTATRATVHLNGADYVTLRNLNILAQGATFGWGVFLTAGADNDTIKDCTISIASTSTTAANTAGVVASGSGTATTTAGNSDGIVIMNNTISGAYQGIILTGGTASILTGNQVIGNTIKDFYAKGIVMTYNSSAVVARNDIKRDTRTVVIAFTGIELGAGNKLAKIDANKIHDTHNAATTQTTDAYGIFATACDALAGQENVFSNNLVYHFNSSSGLIYGLYNSNSDGAWYYNNTVVLDNAASTAGDARGFYQTGLASNIAIRNNIFYLTRGGTGAKNGLYFATTTSTISSNNNVIYVNAPAGTNGVGFYTTNQVTLSNWQSVNGGIYDQLSFSVDPLFVNPAGVDFTSQEVSINNTATLAPGISADINGNPRSTVSPDPGAFENNSFPLDVRLTHFGGRIEGQDALLQWDAVSEKDMAKYEVERSDDGDVFELAGSVKAKGSIGTSSYSLPDRNAFVAARTLYYRLRMVETSGRASYSPTVQLSIDDKGRFAVHAFPNPVGAVLTVRTTGVAGDNANVYIIDVTGKVVRSIKMTGEQKINTAGLSKGAYILRYSDDERTEVISIVKE